MDSYSNTFSDINSYRPSHTDLSYLLLTLNNDNNLKIYGPDEIEITGFTFTEEPLVDNVDGVTLSGETLTVFQYPTPTEGSYRIEITGNNTPYKLETHLYNNIGDLIDDRIISTEGGLPATLNLNYDTISGTSGFPSIISSQKSTTPSDSSAIITWSTDKQTTSRVVYDTISHPIIGSSPNYGYQYSTSTYDENPKVIDHSITITGLSSATVYYYRNISTGSPIAISEERTFKTLSIAGSSVSSDSTEQISNTTAKVLVGNTVYQIQKMQENLKVINNDVLGEKSENQNESLVKNNFVKENKNFFISIFVLLFGICYLQIMKPITGRH